jgi:hypothetical protein
VSKSAGKTMGIATFVLAFALWGGRAASDLLEIRLEDKQLSGLEVSEAASAPLHLAVGLSSDGSERLPPLDLRLVDAGGVGIPADTAAWGGTYSHATHAFDQLILDEAPWIDPDRSAAVRQDWRRYLRRMATYGNNGVVVDAFLELVTFDGLGAGMDVYRSDDPLRQRHLAYRAMFSGFAQDADALGLDVYLKTDLPVITPELERYLRATHFGADPAEEAFWDVYAASFEEVFRTMPGIAGVVVRVGEGGPLFNVDGVEYSSYVGVREPAQLQRMLQTLLPVFERYHRTLIFRSWSVGLGPLGDLHNDPAVYESVLGEIDSPSLVVSTKFVQGDYFGFLPLNPTLAVGPQRRLVEFQARREYEGFGALPNYLGYAHATALRTLRAENPKIVGTFLWTQEGGPLRAGPLSLYDVTGFWRWTDASVYATSRLAIDPTSDPAALAAEWVRDTFGDDPEVVSGLTDVLLDSREALEKALYIRPYARQRVEVIGVEAPPILQVFEWDVLAGWSSVLSTLYRSVEADVETPIDEGYEAVEITRRMRETLARLEPRIGAYPDYPGMMRSLDYQESFYRVLADFRATFLLYYRWLDVGGDESIWRSAAARFDATASEHQRLFGDDLDFPAFDLQPAVTAADRASNSGSSRAWARALALGLVAILGVGLLARRREARVGGAPLGAAGVLATLAVLLLLTGRSWAVSLGAAGLLATYAAALAASWRGPRGERRGWRTAPVTLLPATGAATLFLAVIAIRGPDYWWFLFWTHDAFRAATLGALLATTCWVLMVSYRAGVIVTRSRPHAAAGVLLAGGLVLLALTILLPDLEGTLTALDEPLQLIPMRRAIINGVTHYAGVSEVAIRLPGAVGIVMMLTGAGLRRLARRGRGGGEVLAAPSGS